MTAVSAGVTVLNGLGRNVLTPATRRYSDGQAGGFSGLGLTGLEKAGQGDRAGL